MKVEELGLPGVLLLTPTRFADARGFFTETYNRRTFAAATGLELDFVQDNLSRSVPVGTIRGLHFQSPPAAQVKLVAVLAGAVLDVAVDLRRGSPTYGRHVAVRLSAAAGNQLLVPVGYGHGFCTLEPDTLVAYKVTSHYSAAHDGGLHWADPALGIDWPVSPAAAVVSAKDQVLPGLAALDTPFTIDDH